MIKIGYIYVRLKTNLIVCLLAKTPTLLSTYPLPESARFSPFLSYGWPSKSHDAQHKIAFWGTLLANLLHKRGTFQLVK